MRRKLNSCLWLLAMALAPILTSSADTVVTVDVSVPDQVTITSTDLPSAATVSGSDTIGVYLENFYSTRSAGLFPGPTLVSGSLTNFLNPADASPAIFRDDAASDRGLNFYSFSIDATVDFNTGTQAFSGTATWILEHPIWVEMQTTTTSGNVYFPADTIDDLPTAALIGTYTVIGSSGPDGDILVVNSLADDTIPSDNLVTLREAILAAETDTMTDLGHIAIGADTIDVSGVQGTITLQSSLPAITTPISISGSPSARVTIDGDDGSTRHRLFLVDGGELELHSVDLANGLALGGDGGGRQQRSGAGGGGAGLGGSVFLNTGSLALQDVTVSGSAALGGMGGERELPAGSAGGGGGGGLTLSAAVPIGSHGSAGADGVPLTGLGGAAGTTSSNGEVGGEGAGGGGGGSAASGELLVGGVGGFGGGGGGGGHGNFNGDVTPPAGTGGFGGGGGGRGAGNGTTDGPGATGGMFGGNGGVSTGDGNVGGNGGGGGGLGGAIFARQGIVRLVDVHFADCAATGGAGGTASSNDGSRGQGKGGALFLATGVDAQAVRISFSNNSAQDGTGTGYIENTFVDTMDVYGTIGLLDLIFVDGFEPPL